MKEKYAFYYKRLRRYQDSDENAEKEPSSKSKVKVGLLPLSPLRWGKTGNKNVQLVWWYCCETSCAAMLCMFPPTNQTYLQQIRLLTCPFYRSFRVKECYGWFSYVTELPAIYLPVLPAIPFRYENRSRRQQRPCQSYPPASLRSWLEFDFAGRSAVKTCEVSCCRRCYVLICRSSVAGSTGVYVVGTSATYENQALLS